MRLRVTATGTPALEELLKAHPRVGLESFGRGNLRISFDRGDWPRTIAAANPGVAGPYGLCELMDNNPLVCADHASCPGPAATLALICAGPLARAGLLDEAPAILFSFETDFDEAEAALSQEGWLGINATCEPVDMHGVVAATCLSSVPTTALPDVESLYDECFGRSFFVRRFENGDWNRSLVANLPHAAYRLAPNQSGDHRSVLRIDVLADINGKCGAAQLIHMFNVMACFEEDLGLTT